MKIIQFLRNWTLPIAMLTGVAAYFIYTAIPQLDETHEFVSEAIAYIQPMLIFCMLFLTFCKIDPKSLRLTKWHLWLIMIQVCTFVLLGLPLIFCPENQYRVVLEGAMICIWYTQAKESVSCRHSLPSCERFFLCSFFRFFLRG